MKNIIYILIIATISLNFAFGIEKPLKAIKLKNSYVLSKDIIAKIDEKYVYSEGTGHSSISYSDKVVNGKKVTVETSFRVILVTGPLRAHILTQIYFKNDPLKYKNIHVWYNETQNYYSVMLYESKYGGKQYKVVNNNGEWEQGEQKVFIH